MRSLWLQEYLLKEIISEHEKLDLPSVIPGGGA